MTQQKKKTFIIYIEKSLKCKKEPFEGLPTDYPINQNKLAKITKNSTGTEVTFIRSFCNKRRTKNLDMLFYYSDKKINDYNTPCHSESYTNCKNQLHESNSTVLRNETVHVDHGTEFS